MARFCTSQAKAQSQIRPWVVSFVHQKASGLLQEKSFDGRCLASFIDGLAMLGVQGTYPFSLVNFPSFLSNGISFFFPSSSPSTNNLLGLFGGKNSNQRSKEEKVLAKALDLQLHHLLQGPMVALGPQEAIRLLPALVRLGYAER